MKWLDALKARYVWRFVGTVEGVTRIVRDDGSCKPGGDNRCYWNLYERGDGSRKFTRIGDNLGSPASNYKEAQVRAWVKGGPMPSFEITGTKPPATPKKDKAKLISFPGGKSAQP